MKRSFRKRAKFSFQNLNQMEKCLRTTFSFKCRPTITINYLGLLATSLNKLGQTVHRFLLIIHSVGAVGYWSLTIIKDNLDHALT